MRSTLVIILGFVMIFGTASVIAVKIDHSSDLIQDQLKKAEVLLQSKQWDEASSVIDDAYDSWLGAKNWWAVFLNHSTLDSIEISYQRLQQFALTQDVSQSLAELHTLKILLENIPESESLRLNNIL